MILDLALIIPAVIVGALAHEAMHYLSVLPVAENVRVIRPSPTRLAVEYDYYDEAWRHRYADIANVSPLLVGLIGMLVAWLTVGLPSFELQNAFVFAGWVTFTVGGPADFVRVFA
jgi:hypothetical protein